MLKVIGSAFKRGLTPAMGIVLKRDGIVLASAKLARKGLNLSRLVYWRTEVPADLEAEALKNIKVQVARGASVIGATNFDISFALPSSLLHLGYINIEYQDPKELKQSFKDSAIDTLNELSEGDFVIPDDALLFYEILSNNKKLDEFTARVAWLPADSSKTYLELLRQSGLNPVVLDVEINSLLNLWLMSKTDKELKTLFTHPVALWHVTEDASHLLIVRQDRWMIQEVDLHPGDLIMLKELNRLEQLDIEGFWGEVLSRVATSLRSALSAVDEWEGETSFKHVVVASDLGDISHLIAYLRSENSVQAELLNFPEPFKIDEQAKKYFDFDRAQTRYLSVAASALRTLNPFDAKGLPTERFAFNFLPEKGAIAATRVGRSHIRDWNKIIFLVLLIVLGYSGLKGWDFLNREAGVELNVVQQELDEINSKIQGAQQLLAAEERVAGQLSPDSASKKILGEIWRKLAQVVPVGVRIDSFDYAVIDSKRVLKLTGVAKAEANVVEFQSLFTKEFSAMLANSDNPKTLRESPDAASVSFTWEVGIK